jgi:tetratricopeptide (TPR) repeat protein
MLYATGNYPELEKQSRQILARIDSGRLGYEAVSGRYASFFLGQFYDFKRNWTEAKKFYEQSVTYSEQVHATSSGYYLYALIALGEIAQRQGDKKEAIRYFTKVKKIAGKKNEAYKDAKQRLKKLEKAE